MDLQIHTLLIYVVVLCVVSTFSEIFQRRNLIFPVLRIYGTLLQGLWFCIVAFILFNPIPNATKWNEDDHEQNMLVTAVFVFTAVGAFVFVIAISVIVRCCGSFVERNYSKLSASSPTNSTDSDMSLEPLCDNFEI